MGKPVFRIEPVSVDGRVVTWRLVGDDGTMADGPHYDGEANCRIAISELRVAAATAEIEVHLGPGSTTP